MLLPRSQAGTMMNSTSPLPASQVAREQQLGAAVQDAVARAQAAAAQSAPDDLHCFLLSNVFAKTEKDDKRRMLAVQTTMFYLGKIDGRVNSQEVATVMAARLDPKAAGPQMNACAQRFVHAEQSLQETIKSVPFIDDE